MKLDQHRHRGLWGAAIGLLAFAGVCATGIWVYSEQKRQKILSQIAASVTPGTAPLSGAVKQTPPPEPAVIPDAASPPAAPSRPVATPAAETTTTEKPSAAVKSAGKRNTWMPEETVKAAPKTRKKKVGVKAAPPKPQAEIREQSQVKPAPVALRPAQRNCDSLMAFYQLQCRLQGSERWFKCTAPDGKTWNSRIPGCAIDRPDAD